MQKYIEVIGAKEHNLKNINIKIPQEKFIVITGVSGSGKSSLAFDTLYKEGQRRYVESLSAYARQFLGKVKKPQVDKIINLPPSIAIEQKVISDNPRSTVGTATEIYDYLKILFARIGKTYSPKTGKLVKKHTAKDVIDYIKAQNEGDKILILSPIKINNDKVKQTLDFLKQEGFLRVKITTNNGTSVVKIDDISENEIKRIKQIFVVVDRIKAKKDESNYTRLAESINLAFEISDGYCIIDNITSNKTEEFSKKFEADGIEFLEPSIQLFSFTNPIGACPKCKGFGNILGISEELVIPNPNLSVAEGAIAPWRGEKMSYYLKKFLEVAEKYDFPIFKPYKDLSQAQKNLLWKGSKDFVGIEEFFKKIEKKQDKIQYRVMLARYRGKTICDVCNGTRLRPETKNIKINNKSIQDLVLMEIKDLKKFFDQIQLDDLEKKIAERILTEIKNRINYLCEVGLGYLTLNRAMNTLSGGESQRIRLSTSLGSSLVGSLYVLDEPTIGLHPRDTDRLLKVLKKLKNLGNTVLVVEHEEEVIKNADWIIEMGPKAGYLGGNVVFNGKYEDFVKTNSLTAEYLTEKKEIPLPKHRRKPSTKKGFIKLKGVSHNNLKNIDVKIPLNLIVAITGVSGSGKSSLIKEVLVPAIERYLNKSNTTKPGKFEKLEGDLNKIQNIYFVDQNPVGKSSRSNAATYLKFYDQIRELFANQPLAKRMNFPASYFSFNVPGGRCETCQGEGIIHIDMQFMADVIMICETCKGKRFKDEILEVKINGKNIYDILQMTVDQAYEFFSSLKLSAKEQTLIKTILRNLEILQKVGLNYLQLGQSSSTLSGGENQRLKLANFLANEKKDEKALYIFDEPSVGLHFDDIKKLINALNELADKGNSIIFIEHNLDMIKTADWVIDLGPEGGKNGGEIIFSGTPEDLINCKKSYTARYLKSKIKN